MHRDGKWAKQIISQQDIEGKWGIFHSMSQPTSNNFSTEQALRRLECLGYTIEDECIQKAVSYMNDCLLGKKSTPDYREEKHDWDNLCLYYLQHGLEDLRQIIQLQTKLQDSGQM